MRRRLLILMLAVFTIGLSACGGGSKGDLEAYCRLSAGLDAVQGTPSDKQLDDLADQAPSDIADDVDLVVDRFKGADNDQDLMKAFSDPKVMTAVQNITKYEEKNCPQRTTTSTTTAP